MGLEIQERSLYQTVHAIGHPVVRRTLAADCSQAPDKAKVISAMKIFPILVCALLESLSSSSISFAQAAPQRPESFINTDWPVGIGVILKIEGGRTIITQILPGTPAERDGRLKSGDEITAVGESDETLQAPVVVAGKSAKEIEALLKGPAGGEVKLKIARQDNAGKPQNLVVNLKRAPLPVMTPEQYRMWLERRQDKLFKDGFGETNLNSKIGSPRQEDIVMPSFDAWAGVTNGMTEAHVLEVLGEPKSRLDLQSASVGYWKYGWLHFHSDSLPTPMTIGLHMKNGKVSRKDDPFEGAITIGGHPTIPRQITPANDQLLGYFPRFLDLRWTPSAGNYPIAYTVQIDIHSKDGWSLLKQPKSKMPYCSLDFAGMGKGRWRVRAENSVGESEWSNYRYFTFTQ